MIVRRLYFPNVLNQLLCTFLCIALQCQLVLRSSNLINSGFDIGATIEQTFSPESIKNIALSAGTAGLTQGLLHSLDVAQLTPGMTASTRFQAIAQQLA